MMVFHYILRDANEDADLLAVDRKNHRILDPCC